MKSVLVVGASASVGPAVVEAFLRRRARVLATYRSTDISLEDPRVSTSRLDLRDADGIASFCRGTLAGFGCPDVVTVLAGILPGKSLRDYEPGLIDEVMNVNFSSVAKLVQALLPRLANPAHIILMASIAAERGSYDPVYAASKGALISFAKSLATWLAPDVRVNVVAPGLMEGSAMAGAMTEELREAHRARSPLGQLLGKENLGEIVADLSEDHWRHLNGAVIRVNGGALV
jgi:3-oxoacyl-[acyl-carrier protein] reductase